MANTGKYVSSAADINLHATKLAALLAVAPSLKPFYFFDVGDAAAMLKVDAKTLQRKRKERDAILDRGEVPNPLDISSIAYVPPTPTVKYSAQALEDFLKRLYASTQVRRVGVARMPGKPAAVAILGFQSWLAVASPIETWPFSIQPDGRPMDLCAAIVTGKLTGKAELLTIRAFGERVADAASRAFHAGEKDELATATVRKKRKAPLVTSQPPRI